MKKTTIANILYFVLCLSIIPPAFLDRYSVFHYFTLLAIAVGFVVELAIFVKKRKNDNSLFLLFFSSLFWLVFMVSTLIHSGDLFEVVMPWVRTVLLALLFFNTKEERFQKSFLGYLVTIIIINFATVLLCPNGLYTPEDNINNHYFLGHRNNSIEYILPAIVLSSLYSKKKNTIILCIISSLTVVLTWSANAIVTLTVLISMIVFKKTKIVKILQNTIGYFAIAAISFIEVILLRQQYKFSYFIEEVLHRSTDFTSRERIWDKALYWINESPLIGYGYEDPILKKQKIYHPNSCHNYVLDFLYMGGILELGTIVMFIAYAFKKLNEKTARYKSLFASAIIAYGIMGFATPIHKDSFCIVLFVLIMASYAIKRKKEKND